MKLCIAEKPSVARDIASILGARDRRDGYYEGNGWQVTWVFGHLCELKEPHEYNPFWKGWSLAQLPMIPERFGIKLKDDAGVKRQFRVIETLAAGAEEIVNCGDAGQEGELIQRWVMQLAHVKCPVRRLWISSLTDEALRAGFASLRPAADFDKLYHAGLARAIGDWLLGMNATRLYTQKYGTSRQVLSIGRVQTPTLALIVARQHEIDNFHPEPYWELKTLYRDATFSATAGRYPTEEEAQRVLQEIAPAPLTVTDVATKRGHDAPPRLFDLTSLQVETNKKWGWSAEETLSLIQALYEKKVTTYPRVDTTYLTDDIYPQVPKILQGMKPYASLTAPLLASKLKKSKKVFDNSKVTDHHAIIPTGVSPEGVLTSPKEKRLYHLIALRFLAVFYPDCEFDRTTVDADIAGHKFRAQGKTIITPGWRALYASEKTENPDADSADDAELPEFRVGESGPHTPSLRQKQTQPPKPYSEGTLLRAMETAGKTVDDEALRDALKENGIGRPSTRAAIIETLFRRRYIMRQGKTLRPTRAGIELIGLIHEELLKSAKLTGIWENKLRRIERGDYSPADFIDELKEMITGIVDTVLRDNTSRKIVVEAPPAKAAKKNSEGKPAKPRAPRVTKLEQIKCPQCGEGHLLKGRAAYGCSRYASGCPLRLPFEEFPSDLTPGKLNTLIKKKIKT